MESLEGYSSLLSTKDFFKFFFLILFTFPPPQSSVPYTQRDPL